VAVVSGVATRNIQVYGLLIGADTTPHDSLRVATPLSIKT
jgi:hypothetical protein